jgi:hypothetical protein
VDKKQGRGGKRTGAGRPPIGSARTESLSITLPPEAIAYLRTVDDNLSKAIRILIERDQSR